MDENHDKMENNINLIVNFHENSKQACRLIYGIDLLWQ
jgi:hypothetical protein